MDLVGTFGGVILGHFFDHFEGPFWTLVTGSAADLSARWTLHSSSEAGGSLRPLGRGFRGRGQTGALVHRAWADDGKGVLASCLHERTRRELQFISGG